MIPDTDEELIAEAAKYEAAIHRGVGGSVKEVIFTQNQLRALINHYIVKDRAQGQEPVGNFDVYDCKDGGKSYIQIKDKYADETTIKLYTHAQPIAELQAEPLAYAEEGRPANVVSAYLKSVNNEPWIQSYNVPLYPRRET